MPRVGSFDPNYKEVSPRGIGANGNITLKDSALNYTLHFQNTGTWPAQKVVLKDTLSANLNIASLRPGYSTPACTTTVSETGIVTFTFNNINLPDSGSNQAGSNGLVMCIIHLKNGLAVGSQIKNSASIYFDYNAPVKTNTTVNTIVSPAGIETTPVAEKLVLTLYPNPATDRVTMRIQSLTGASAARVWFANLLGQVMLQQDVSIRAGENLFSADVSRLTPGVYFVEIANGQQRAAGKLNVLR